MWPDLRDAIIVTLQLGFYAYVLTVVFGLTIGIISAVKQYSWFDSLATGVSFFGLSIPPFFFGLMLQIILVLKFKDWFGSTPFYTSGVNNSTETGLGFDRMIHLTLPAITLGLFWLPTLVGRGLRRARARVSSRVIPVPALEDITP